MCAFSNACIAVFWFHFQYGTPLRGFGRLFSIDPFLLSLKTCRGCPAYPIRLVSPESFAMTVVFQSWIVGLFYCQPIWPPESKNSLFTLDDHMVNIALHGLRNIAEARADSESLEDSRQSFREINPFRFERAQGDFISSAERKGPPHVGGKALSRMALWINRRCLWCMCVRRGDCAAYCLMYWGLVWVVCWVVTWTAARVFETRGQAAGLEQLWSSSVRIDCDGPPCT